MAHSDANDRPSRCSQRPPPENGVSSRALQCCTRLIPPATTAATAQTLVAQGVAPYRCSVARDLGGNRTPSPPPSATERENGARSVRPAVFGRHKCKLSCLRHPLTVHYARKSRPISANVGKVRVVGSPRRRKALPTTANVGKNVSAKPTLSRHIAAPVTPGSRIARGRIERSRRAFGVTRSCGSIAVKEPANRRRVTDQAVT